MTGEHGEAQEICARYETRLSGTATHCNRTVCVLVGRDGPIALTSGRVRVEADAILVRPGAPHRLAFGAQSSTILYFDHALWPEDDRAPARPLNLAERELALACAPGRIQAAAALVERLRLEPLELRDIEAVTREIAADPMARMSQDSLARRLGCERTNALKKFKARTGLTFRGYKQWRAVRAATYALLDGAAIGEAALDAGFADAAHFSRTFRNVFGVSPSEARSAQAPILNPDPA